MLNKKVEDNDYIAVPIKEYKKILECIDCFIEDFSSKFDCKRTNENKLINILEAEIKKQKEIRLSTSGINTGFAERVRIRIDGKTEGLKFAIEKIKEMEENKI